MMNMERELWCCESKIPDLLRESNNVIYTKEQMMVKILQTKKKMEFFDKIQATCLQLKLPSWSKMLNFSPPQQHTQRSWQDHQEHQENEHEVLLSEGMKTRIK